MRFIAILLLLPLLSACASLTQEQCIAGDWQQIGYYDGVNGRNADHISRHFDACSDLGISPDLAAWTAGREQGLPQYCTIDNAYERGRNGQNFNQVCPAVQRYSLERAHDWGMEYHEISEDIDQQESDRREVQRDIAVILALPEPSDEDLLRLAHFQSEIRDIDRDIRRLKRALRRYDRLPF